MLERRRGSRFLSPKEHCNEKTRTSAPQRGDCVSTLWPVPRLAVTSATVLEAWQDGRTMYADSSALAGLRESARYESRTWRATLEGTLTNSVGRPLRNAIVNADSLGRVARTDSLGMFRMQPLPSGALTLVIRCRGQRTVRVRVAMGSDSTRRLSGVLQPDSLVTNAGTDCSRWQ